MPELRKRRSHLALLGVFAMVASVLAVGASPATAAPGTPEGAATYSACVGPAAQDAGFTDVATGSTHDAAVNCIAYYEITKGTTATTFAPNENISRGQLAVMLQRAAGPADVELPSGEAMGFTDISGMSDSWQTAINQMARLGVMAGTSATTFDPEGIVSRAVIVEALAGFLTAARPGPGGKALSRGADLSLTVKVDGSDGAMTVPVDETFRDLGGVNYSAFQSIRALAEMGVVSGRGDGTFGPAASVTRAQAAAFITRALAHTNARPAGLTMQTSKPAYASDQDFDLSISVRGNDFAPIEDASVDVIKYLPRNAQSAFKTDDTCNIGALGVEGSIDPCTISISDEVTEPDGNLLSAAGTISQETVFVAWTGATGAKLDWGDASLSRNNADNSSASVLTVGTVTLADKAKVTTSVSPESANGNTVRYGTTVTVTIQLLDAKNADIGVAGKAFTWHASGVHTPPTSVLAGTGSRMVVTDSTGKATFTLTQSDPDTNKEQDLTGQDPDANDSTLWTYVITAVGTDDNPAVNPWVDTTINSPDGYGFSVNGATGTGTVLFDDNPSEAAKVSLALSRSWTPQSTSGGTASVGLTGKVIDQYGRNLPRQDIFFDVNGDALFGCTRAQASDPCAEDVSISDRAIDGTTRRTTRSSGSNTISASLTGGATTTATAEPVYRIAADLTGDGDVDDAGEQDMVTHYWTQPPAGLSETTGIAQSTGQAPMLVADLANNAIVQRSVWPTPDPADATFMVPRVYTYTDTTLFQWYVSGAPNNVRWLNLEQFESRMAKHLAVPNNMGRPNGTFGVTQYNSKTGFSVYVIRLNPGQDIQDPDPAG